MEARKCEAFVTAVECGSLTEAGELLGYTQPGITRMVRSLERELGFRLLVRGNRGVEPTANGLEMLPVMRELVRACQRVVEQGSQIHGVLSGTLRVGCYWSIASRWLPTVLARYCELHPGVVVNVHEEGNRGLARWVEERSVDLCLCGRPNPGLACDWIPIREDELVAWLPPDHPKASLAALPVRDVDGEAFVATLPGEDTDIDRFLTANDLHPDVRFVTASYYTTFCMVEAGLGISLDNRLISSRWDGDVVTLPFDPPQYVSLGIAVPSLAEVSPAARRFIEVVEELRPQLA